MISLIWFLQKFATFFASASLDDSDRLLSEKCSIVTLLVEFYVLSRKQIPCKIMQGKYFLARSFKETISLQDLARETFPFKIFQGNNFLARSCKEKISLKDLPRKAYLQGSCKILARNAFFFQPGFLRAAGHLTLNSTVVRFCTN